MAESHPVVMHDTVYGRSASDRDVIDLLQHVCCSKLAPKGQSANNVVWTNDSE